MKMKKQLSHYEYLESFSKKDEIFSNERNETRNNFRNKRK